MNFETFPNEILQLSQLETLDLSLYPLFQLPPEICMLTFFFCLIRSGKLKNLRELALYGSLLTSLPREIGKIPHFRSLDVYTRSDSPIFSHLDQLPHTLSSLRNPTLQRVLLSEALHQGVLLQSKERRTIAKVGSSSSGETFNQINRLGSSITQRKSWKVCHRFQLEPIQTSF